MIIAKSKNHSNNKHCFPGLLIVIIISFKCGLRQNPVLIYGDLYIRGFGMCGKGFRAEWLKCRERGRVGLRVYGIGCQAFGVERSWD